MNRLELDFLRTRRPPAWASFVLLALAMAFAGDIGWSYRNLSADVEQIEARLAASSSLERNARPTSIRPIAREEYAFARETVRWLSTPWERLFGALEGAQTVHVALLAIEPDAENGTVSLQGEAKDYFAMLTYVARLGEEKALRRVHLVQHEMRRGAPQRAVAFTISASWKEGR